MLLALLAAACAATPAELPSASPTAPSQATPSPSASPSPSTAVPTIYDTSALGSAFPLAMSFELPEHWKPLAAPLLGPRGTLGVVHTGDPATDTSQWWGPEFELVDGASVIDPAELNKPATASDAKSPWPASYIDYLVSLPGVEVVHAPESVTVGGVQGRQVTVTTPPMHPTIFLKGDTAWLGGGPSGLDPALERKVIELTVDGKKLLFNYLDDPAAFDSRLPEVDAIIDSIAFGQLT
jgi:hypothetical protein